MSKCLGFIRRIRHGLSPLGVTLGKAQIELVKNELARWTPIIKAAKVKVE